MALTDEQIERDWQGLHGEDGSQPDQHAFARAIEAAAEAPLLERIAALEAQVEQAAQPSEQAAFEDWLHRVCPSGDVTDVKRQWEASSDLAEWLESQRTEDVLIDGVAYTVPIEVACELLHLHMALLTKPAQAAQPAAWIHVCRKRPELRFVSFNKVEPALAAKGYKASPLYTSPPKAAPLTDEKICALRGQWFQRDLKPEIIFHRGIRAAEAAHGITPATVEKG